MEYKRTSVQQLMQAAAAESFSFRHATIDTEHLLLAMMKTGGIETQALTQAGANYNTLRKIVLSNNEPGSSPTPSTHTSAMVRRLMEQARQIASQNGENEVYAEYVLFAILNDKSGLAPVMLTIADVDRRQVYQNLVALLRENRPKTRDTNLDEYGRNLNEEAENGDIDPVIGREKEINRIIQILSRRTKNNPVLIGEPGVGKTAIAEGLARRIVTGDVPDIMRDKVVYSIDMASMVAGTKYRGDFEQRLSDTIDELMDSDNAIVFIDELHTIIGAGSSEGSLDASNILKPALAKGKLQIIGATTIDEYRKRIEKDAALERRFQPVMVEEPSRADTIAIIRGLRPRYEAFHHVRITDDAITAATELTDRYLPDRFLPDKAIDVIDEALARVHVEAFHVPEEELKYREEQEHLEDAKQRAALSQNFEEAARLRDRLAALEEEHEAFLSQEPADRDDWPAIDFDHIAAIVSQWSSVPVTRLTETETEKYLYLDAHLKRKVIGQDHAVDSVSAALKRARVGLKSEGRPIGSFIFVGPTGVGKTYLAKEIARQLFGSEENMIRIDMSEYMERFSTSRLVGSAPGYVGYEEGGQLTEMVRKKPYSVVLFDEIEKAHPDVFNMLLQVLDDGRLTDSQGRTVDFRNTVIIMTSNVGASQLSTSQRFGFGLEETVEETEYDRMKEVVHEELKHTFRPEFLNRVDDIIVFHKLSEKSILRIAMLLMDELMGRVERLGYHMTYTEPVARHLAKSAYQPEFGARPLERAIRTRLEDLLAEKMLKGELKADRQYELHMDNKEIVVSEKAPLPSHPRESADAAEEAAHA
ncbi:MAG: ATP-dependent Clp protease ATP-binding subunit [Peptoniphilaceae bacterium]|nr:ATP-dependent Clp protease ATP-binding subunit [Peptoniphilaceae bacterium]MDY6085375.1 ATP-dependent Clp protease ATP-binding subunit [Peptoniphilaceae bacterium]